MTNPVNSRSRYGRVYVWPPSPPHELEVPNVTGIISKGLPKPFLKRWGERMVAEFAYKRRNVLLEMDEAEAVDFLKGAPYRHTRSRGDIGTEVHDLIEHHTQGLPLPDTSDEARRFFQGYLRFEEDFSPTYEHLEVTAYSRQHGYAGTGDAVGSLGERPDWGRCMIDWKTSKSLYGSYALQLAALANADFFGVQKEDEWVEEPVGEITTGVLVRFTVHGEYEVRKARIDEDVFTQFLFCKQVARWDSEFDRTALSSPVILPGAPRQIVEIESSTLHEAVAWLRDNGPATLTQLAEGLEITERAARGRMKKAYGEFVQYDEETQLFSVNLTTETPA